MFERNDVLCQMKELAGLYLGSVCIINDLISRRKPTVMEILYSTAQRVSGDIIRDQ